ncbi:hypothetical protein AB0J82_15360 [Asanoa sp. NPDC049518]|uniref:hypothetical protein n=1 Tax=unclassified Asanoa TaxID=2685164 RepID=UPI003414692E
MMDVNHVDWRSFPTPFGPAGEIPRLVADLTSAASEARLAAYERAKDLVAYMGQRSEVSVQLVPFLLDLVRDPAVVEKDAAMLLLCDIAVGDQLAYLDDPPDWPALRREVARKQTLSVADLEREARDHERSLGGSDLDARLEMLESEDLDIGRQVERDGVQAYDAVRAGVPVFADLLRSANPLHRVYAEYLVGFFLKSGRGRCQRWSAC